MKRLTSENGRPIADNQNTQTAGQRGPVTLQDPWLLEKLAHFDREVIPERRMHAKGAGAFGTFTVTHDISKYTRASAPGGLLPGRCFFVRRGPDPGDFPQWGSRFPAGVPPGRGQWQQNGGVPRYSLRQ